MATAESSIKQLLADRGIEVRKTGDATTRELWRGADFLGHYSARSAVLAFLPEFAA